MFNPFSTQLYLFRKFILAQFSNTDNSIAMHLHKSKSHICNIVIKNTQPCIKSTNKEFTLYFLLTMTCKKLFFSRQARQFFCIDQKLLIIFFTRKMSGMLHNCLTHAEIALSNFDVWKHSQKRIVNGTCRVCQCKWRLPNIPKELDIWIFNLLKCGSEGPSSSFIEIVHSFKWKECLAPTVPNIQQG